ncbi:hypothetical protein AB5J62_14835 [Amycolatopsis sp. cg5]|uniref:hypothetical protein n=1 Tax=Amycolatopsis sp. cg5 TaxID=3238802 RepID=UPI00352417F5
MSTRTHEPDPEAVARLLDDLEDVKIHDGDPSLGELSKRSEAIGRFVSKATFSRSLSGTLLPKWSIVETFLLVCGIDAQEITGFWKPRWVLASGGSAPTDRPGAQYEHACPTCGTVTASPPSRPHLSAVPA